MHTGYNSEAVKEKHLVIQATVIQELRKKVYRNVKKGTFQ